MRINRELRGGFDPGRFVYSPDEFRALAVEECGYRPVRAWVDGKRLFSVHHLEARAPSGAEAR